MDKQMKSEIIALVREMMQIALEDAEEKWLSPDDFAKHFAMFTKDWLKHYGEYLPRYKAPCSNRWAYPMHATNRLIKSGQLKVIMMHVKMYHQRKNSA